MVETRCIAALRHTKIVRKRKNISKIPKILRGPIQMQKAFFRPKLLFLIKIFNFYQKQKRRSDRFFRHTPLCPIICAAIPILKISIIHYPLKNMLNIRERFNNMRHSWINYKTLRLNYLHKD